MSRSRFEDEFVRAGFSYEEARRAYAVLLSVFENSIISGDKVTLGRIGALVPTKRPPRIVKMGFKRTKEGVEKVGREFLYGETIRWKFRIYRRFAKKHQVDGRI